jgi:hypothetical protein
VANVPSPGTPAPHPCQPFANASSSKPCLVVDTLCGEESHWLYQATERDAQNRRHGGVG